MQPDDCNSLNGNAQNQLLPAGANARTGAASWYASSVNKFCEIVIYLSRLKKYYSDLLIYYFLNRRVSSEVQIIIHNLQMDLLEPECKSVYHSLVQRLKFSSKSLIRVL